MQLKRGAAVTYIKHIVNQLFAKIVSSNPQPQQQQKKNSCVKLVLHSLSIGIAVEMNHSKKN